MVFQPVFSDVLGPSGTPLVAGKTFAVDWRGESFLLTAHHLFGPGAGLEQQLSAEDVASSVRSVVLLDPATGARLATAGPTVLNARAAVHESTAADDLVILRFDGVLDAVARSATVLPLAAGNPSVGETVCVVTSLAVGQRLVRAYTATVREVSRGELMYRFEEDFELTATSGAPVVNLDGKVVGMNTRGGEAKGIHFGFANSIESIRQALEAALPAAPDPSPLPATPTAPASQH